jgi:ubiquinone/menaquinone biosynthesis C-methylase UbiE
MVEAAPNYDDSAGYERFMGRWSRAVAPVFLDWVHAPAGASWLEVGCGTGAFTETVLDRCAPASVSAVDHSDAQIASARTRFRSRQVDFRVADGQALPFPDESFDVVASALVINFLPDRPRAVGEMRRVLRKSGVIAAYVWDFAAERSPSGPVRRSMRRLGAEVPPLPGTQDSTLDALASLFEEAGLEEIEVRTIEATVAYVDFEDFWQAQTPAYLPTSKTIAAMSPAERSRLTEAVRAELPAASGGRIEYSARANAIKVRGPG